MARSDALLVLLTEDEKAKLRELAERDGRSMNGYVRRLISQAAQQQPQAA